MPKPDKINAPQAADPIIEAVSHRGFRGAIV